MARNYKIDLIPHTSDLTRCMALELLITFRDSKRKNVFHPFALLDVLRRAWLPLAARLRLPLLQQLECLDIKDRREAEALISEFEVVRKALAEQEAVCISKGDAEYMLKRIREVEPLIRVAIEDWDDVESISL